MQRHFCTEAILRDIRETINRGNVNRATFNTELELKGSKQLIDTADHGVTYSSIIWRRIMLTRLKTISSIIYYELLMKPCLVQRGFVIPSASVNKSLLHHPPSFHSSVLVPGWIRNTHAYLFMCILKSVHITFRRVCKALYGFLYSYDN